MKLGIPKSATLSDFKSVRSSAPAIDVNKAEFPNQSALSHSIIDAGILIAEKIYADAIILITNSIDDYEALKNNCGQKIVMCVTDVNKYFHLKREIPNLIYISSEFTHHKRIRVAVIKALSSNMLIHEDNVVCISDLTKGMTGINSITHFNIANEVPGISRGFHEISVRVRPDVFEAAVSIALDLSAGGESGYPQGTTFVLGDTENVLKLCKQMTFNPFKGYQPWERNITDMSVRENVKQFAKLDGGFVIEKDGVIMSAGCFFWADTRGLHIPPGLGTRHTSAAAITKQTKAIAVVVSASGGVVRIFMDGEMIEELN